MKIDRLRRCWAGVAGTGVLALIAAGPALAAGPGYGGVSGTTITPTGFTSVVSASIFGARGGELRLRTGGGALEVAVPGNESAAFEVAVTKGRASAVTQDLAGSLKGYQVVSSFGVALQAGPKAATASKSLIITFKARTVARGDKVVVYSARTGTFNVLSSAIVKSGEIIVHLNAGESIAVVKK